ncbi:FecR family protein [Puteibacter caeruleilacunae]|nr:FecR family protein [Puteibacter caeruleilacunae]
MDILEIIKLISGRTSQQEKEELLDQLSDNEEALAQYARLKNAWELSSRDSSLPKLVVQDNLKSVNKKIKRKEGPTIISIGRTFWRYAAVLIVALIMGIFIEKQLNVFVHKNHLSVVEVPMGQTAKITLPDSTLVWLNSGSSISYPSTFTMDERTVKILGEAFLEVKKNQDSPFKIENPKLNIKVTGTQFNFKAYPDEDIATAALVEGSIEASIPTLKHTSKLEPGQLITFNSKNKKISLSKVDTKLYTSWRDGYIVLKDKPFGEFLKQIERWYNVDIILENQDIANQLYGGTILRNKPLDQVFEILQVMAGIEYEIKNYPDKKSTVIIK